MARMTKGQSCSFGGQMEGRTDGQIFPKLSDGVGGWL